MIVYLKKKILKPFITGFKVFSHNTQINNRNNYWYFRCRYLDDKIEYCTTKVYLPRNNIVILYLLCRQIHIINRLDLKRNILHCSRQYFVSYSSVVVQYWSIYAVPRNYYLTYWLSTVNLFWPKCLVRYNWKSNSGILFGKSNRRQFLGHFPESCGGKRKIIPMRGENCSCD